jgi:signal transduction histidine kinase
MRLSSFISANLAPILVDWVAFARVQLPAAARLDEAELLDHGRSILQEIAADMLRPERDGERRDKSEGNSALASTSEGVPSRSHARQRERQGFEIEQMVAEYRALRATVLRLWSAASDDVQQQDLEDVTRFNEAVDQAMAESLKTFVEEVNRTRDLFLGMLGHDLRGPLSTIAGCAHLMRHKWPDDTAQTALVLRSVAHMKALLDDLTEYTRGRLGDGLSVDPAPLDLARFARDALKYGDASAAPEVQLDGTAPDQVVISVENRGRPIAADLLPRLFDPLVRAEGDGWSADSQVAGANLGLGLFVVREIATAHGGTVDVVSDSTSTRFELRLPRLSRRRTSTLR